MLNPFPIQFLSMLAYTLLRVCVGVMLLAFSKKHYVHRRSLAKTFSIRIFPYGNFSAWIFIVAEFVLGIMFILGFYTQIAALLTMIMTFILIAFHKVCASRHLETRTFYTLLFFAALSLFITGAGALAFDLPI